MLVASIEKSALHKGVGQLGRISVVIHGRGNHFIRMGANVAAWREACHEPPKQFEQSDCLAPADFQQTAELQKLRIFNEVFFHRSSPLPADTLPRGRLASTSGVRLFAPIDRVPDSRRPSIAAAHRPKRFFGVLTLDRAEFGRLNPTPASDGRSRRSCRSFFYWNGQGLGHADLRGRRIRVAECVNRRHDLFLGGNGGRRSQLVRGEPSQPPDDRTGGACRRGPMVECAGAWPARSVRGEAVGSVHAR